MSGAFRRPRVIAVALVPLLLLPGLVVPTPAGSHGLRPPNALRLGISRLGGGTVANGSSVANFSAALQRLVTLVGASGSGVLALVWARVALSWFSNDVSKKIQAKERARDALIGSLLFVAALTGLVWGLAHWVLTGA